MAAPLVGCALAALSLAVAPPAVAEVPRPTAAPEEVEAERRAWYVPDHAKLQLAGSIGFVSPGIGFSWLDRRLEADLFFGWVPPELGGESIFSLTAKVGVLPWRIQVGEWEIRPATAAVQLTYTVGDEYWVRQPAGYPDDYYPIPTALRAGIALGGGVGRRAGSLEHVGLYYEVVAIDTMLASWIGNRNAVGIAEVFTLAVGARADL